MQSSSSKLHFSSQNTNLQDSVMNFQLKSATHICGWQECERSSLWTFLDQFASQIFKARTDFFVNLASLSSASGQAKLSTYTSAWSELMNWSIIDVLPTWKKVDGDFFLFNAMYHLCTAHEDHPVDLLKVSWDPLLWAPVHRYLNTWATYRRSAPLLPLERVTSVDHLII